jgi:hypothetical protein
MANESLQEAKRSPNDEFYTQYHDIEKEVNAYLEFDPNTFRDKVLLLPCDDPEWSAFTRFFATQFERLGLKKLISTSYALNAKPKELNLQPTLFEIESPQFDDSKALTRGKIFVLDKDHNGDNKIDLDDLAWTYLEGDGDFQSAEVTKLRDEADLIITNPPFSLFREFLFWMIEANKGFLIIGPMPALTYKDVYPLIEKGKLWLGNGFEAGNAYFKSPSKNNFAEGVFDENTGMVKFRNVDWFTNLDHGRRHEPLVLMTQDENVKYGKGPLKDFGYQEYDNYNAIEVPTTKSIPSDYMGLMGVPASFLQKHNPDQFEVVGMSGNGTMPEGSLKPGQPKYDRPYMNGRRMYVRIFIRRKGTVE